MTANAGDPVIYDRCFLSLPLGTEEISTVDPTDNRHGITVTDPRSSFYSRDNKLLARIVECALVCVSACLFKVKGMEGREGGESDADKVIYIPR